MVLLVLSRPEALPFLLLRLLGCCDDASAWFCRGKKLEGAYPSGGVDNEILRSWYLLQVLLKLLWLELKPGSRGRCVVLVALIDASAADTELLPSPLGVVCAAMLVMLQRSSLLVLLKLLRLELKPGSRGRCVVLVA